MFERGVRIKTSDWYQCMILVSGTRTILSPFSRSDVMLKQEKRNKISAVSVMPTNTAYATLRRRDFEVGTRRRVCRMISVLADSGAELATASR